MTFSPHSGTMSRAGSASRFRRRKGGLFLVGMSLLLGVLWLSGEGMFYGAARRVGYAVCHQLPGHSYWALGMPLPLCARCTGQYLGALVMLVYLAVAGGRWVRRWPTWWGVALSGLLVLAWAVDGVNSYLDFLGMWHLYAPRNILRLLSGMGEGVALMAFFWPMFAQATWSAVEEKRVRARDVLAALSIAYALALLIHFGDGRVRYTLGLVSALGVLVVMSMLFSVFLRLVSRRVGESTSGWELALFLAGGLAVALLLIAGVGALRDLLPPIGE